MYHAWKAKNKKKGGAAGAAKDPLGMGAMMGAVASNMASPSGAPDMSFEEGMRAPNSVLEEAARTPTALAVERKAVVSNQDQARRNTKCDRNLRLI